MKISEIKEHLSQLKEIAFKLPNGDLVPEHFHITEVGEIRKKFIDCGATQRTEMKANFQLWEAEDYDHRLHPEKLISIIKLSERVLNLGNLDIEVEYQGDTIGKYHLDFDGKYFLLLNKRTDCLAKDKCGIEDKPKIKINQVQKSICAPGSGCC